MTEELDGNNLVIDVDTLSDKPQTPAPHPSSLPLAGSTGYFLSKEAVSELREGDDPQKLKNKIYFCEYSKFVLRVGPDYSSKKLKAQCTSALMDLVGCDMYSSAERIDDVGSRVKLPEEWTNIDTHGSGVPPLFIVNCQLPSDCSVATILRNVFTNITDGPGYSFVLYFRLNQESLDALRDESTASPALKLFAEYCREAPKHDHDLKSKYKGRFKVICNVDNIDEFGLPGMIKSFNSKPVLIRQSGRVIRGESYVEMDANLHSFGSVFRKGLAEVLPMYERMVLFMGFCVESRDDHEMPETLFGSATFNCPVLATSPSWPSSASSIS